MHGEMNYRVVTINVSRIWIEWAEWAALSCTANSPFPGHVYRHHPVGEREWKGMSSSSRSRSLG